MPLDVDVYVRDCTTGSLRLATRGEEDQILGQMPERFHAEGVWTFDDTLEIYRRATRDEAREIRQDEPSNWRYERERERREQERCERERRRRRRRRHR